MTEILFGLDLHVCSNAWVMPCGSRSFRFPRVLYHIEFLKS